jgi:hypothetical protein
LIEYTHKLASENRDLVIAHCSLHRRGMVAL